MAAIGITTAAACCPPDRRRPKKGQSTRVISPCSFFRFLRFPACAGMTFLSAEERFASVDLCFCAACHNNKMSHLAVLCETSSTRRAGRGPVTGVPLAPPGLAVNCAKQTQFRQRGDKRQMLCEEGVMVNSTFDRRPQNKANSGGVANRAKQTQFARRGRAAPLAPQADYAERTQSPGSRAPWNVRLCKTKPIWEGVSGLKFQALRRARPWSGLHTSHFTLQTRPRPPTPKDWRAGYRRVTWCHVSSLGKEIV